MLILDNMPYLEGEIRMGLLVNMLIKLAEEVTFSKGIIVVNGVKVGTHGVELTIDNIEDAIEEVIRASYRVPKEYKKGYR